MKLEMTLKYVNYYTSKGRTFAYYRRSGKRIRIRGEVNSFEFIENYNRIHGQFEGHSDAFRLGTLGQLAKDYIASPQFAELAPRTKKDYNRVIDYLLYQKNGKPRLRDMPLIEITRGFIVELRDFTYQDSGYKLANYCLAILNILLKRAMERENIQTNPAEGVSKIKRPKSMPKANRSWSDEERHVVLENAPDNMKVPIAIGMYTGLRMGDVVGLMWKDIKDGQIVVETGKTGQKVYIPIHPTLRSFLNPNGSTHVCVNSLAKPWKLEGFKTSFPRYIKRLQKIGKVGAGLTFHGLRHTVAKNLIEAGANLEDIKAMLGHANSNMTKHYAKEAENRAGSARIIPLIRE